MAAPLQPGTMLRSEMRIERLIGAGGMASVWLARDLANDRDVAVKVMAEGLAADPISRARFAREATIGLSLESPHIVRTLGHGTAAGDLPYIVMELCAGESLRHRMERV